LLDGRHEKTAEKRLQIVLLKKGGGHPPLGEGRIDPDINTLLREISGREKRFAVGMQVGQSDFSLEVGGGYGKNRATRQRSEAKKKPTWGTKRGKEQKVKRETIPRRW